MTGRKGAQVGEWRWLRGFRAAIAVLAVAAILCAVPVLAHPARLAQVAAPAAEPPAVAAAPVLPGKAPAAKSSPAAGPGAVAEPTVDQPKSSPRITDALLPSALPRDLSPWGMFLGAVPLVKIVMVGLAFASLATWTVWLAKTIELWNARRAARKGLEVLASAKSLRAAERNSRKHLLPWRASSRQRPEKPIAPVVLRRKV